MHIMACSEITQAIQRAESGTATAGRYGRRPSYFFKVHQVPFAGTLPLMVNHFPANDDSARFYRVRVDGVTQMDPWTDEKWVQTHYAAQTITATTVSGVSGYYPRAPGRTSSRPSLPPSRA